MSFSLSAAARQFLEAGPVWADDGFVERPGVRFVVAAVASLLRRAPIAAERISPADVDEALLHALISIDAPRPDRVHLELVHQGRVRPFRDVVTLLQGWPRLGIGGAIARIDTTLDDTFDVDPDEAFRRVVAIYTIQYSNFMPYAPAVRANFRADPPARQQGFLRAFLELYEQGTDVTHLPGADAAVAWLRSTRVHRGRHRLVLSDDLDRVVAPPDLVELEVALREALEEVAAAAVAVHQVGLAEVKQAPWYLARPERHRLADELLPAAGCEIALEATRVSTASAPTHHAALVELLGALKVPPPVITLQALTLACRQLLDEPLPYDPPPSVALLVPRLETARARLTTVVDEALRRAC